MRTQPVLAHLLRVIASVSLAAMIVPACADIISLSDGRLLEGEVIEEQPAHVVFRHNVAGIWTNTKFKRADIDVLERQDGDQSDSKLAPPTTNPNAGPAVPGATADDSQHTLPQVMIVPLHGTVGGTRGQSLRDTFDAGMLEDCFAAAEKAGAKIVILDINSPGGLVSEMELICQTIINWHSRLRIVAFPRDAFSAAAIISLCCREMGVRPDSRIGAAVIIQTGNGAPTAVDAKMASPHHALQKQFMSASGRPYDVVSAMTIQETQLWWSPEKGFVTTAPPSGDGAAWTQVDGASTVLTMTAADAVKWGLSLGACANEQALLRRMGVIEEVEIVRMDEEVGKYLDALDRRFKDLIKQSNNYFTALGGLVESLGKLRDAYSARDRDSAGRLKADIKQQVTRLQNAGRAIGRIDKSLLARRVDVPEEVVEQMKTDAAVLGRINGLLNTDTADGFNESVDRLNAVITSWRKLLGVQ